MRREASPDGSAPQALVRVFHERMGYTVSERPQVRDLAERLQRAELMQEELDEYVEAVKAGDLPEMADALADLAYFVYGTAVVLGVDLAPIILATHEANMQKIPAPDGGKAMKPPGWRHPDVAALLQAQIDNAS